MVQSWSAETCLWGRIGRQSFPGKCFLHLHTGLQVQWWLMMSTADVTSLNKHYIEARKTIQMLLYIVTYQVQELGPSQELHAGASSSGSSGSLFSSLNSEEYSFLSGYDPSHSPLTQQGHRHWYPHCPYSCTRVSLRLSYEDLLAIINWSLFFDNTVWSVPWGSTINIPRERAAQCACAGTYSMCIALTQSAQSFFEN